MSRILFIDDDIGFAGASVSMAYIIEKFVENHEEVFVFTQKNQKDRDRLSKTGARIISYQSRFVNNLALDLYFTNKYSPFSSKGMNIITKNVLKIILGVTVYTRLFCKYKPDLVYINEYVILQAAMAAKLLGIKTVMHIRSRFIRGTFGVRRLLLRKAVFNLTDLVFAITEIEAKQIGRPEQVRSKVKVVNEFLDDQNYKYIKDSDTKKEKYGIPKDKKIVLMLGGILPIKGTLDYLASAEIISAKRSDIYFILAGSESRIDQEYCTRCHMLIDILNSRNCFVYTGLVENVNELISCSDILVSANAETHFPRPVIEAWAKNKAVVATETIHNSKLITDGKNGRLVKVSDPKDMAAAIEEISDSDILASELGRNGNYLAHLEFDAGKNTSSIYAMCAKLMRN